MKCIIINEEIEKEECECIILESHKDKKTKLLPKRFKRIAGWDLICKACQHHEIPKTK